MLSSTGTNLLNWHKNPFDENKHNSVRYFIRNNNIAYRILKNLSTIMRVHVCIQVLPRGVCGNWIRLVFILVWRWELWFEVCNRIVAEISEKKSIRSNYNFIVTATLVRPQAV